MITDSQQETQRVSQETIYTQLCTELGRCRDHELTVGVWFSALQLATLAAIVGGKYAATGSPLGVALERCPSLKWFLALVPILLGVFAAWSIADAMRQMGQLRKRLRDTFNRGTDRLDASSPSVLKPGTLMCAVLIFLGILSAVLIIHKTSVLG
jgi:hypothetical protein